MSLNKKKQPSVSVEKRLVESLLLFAFVFNLAKLQVYRVEDLQWIT